MLIEINAFSGVDEPWEAPLVGCFGSD